MSKEELNMTKSTLSEKTLVITEEAIKTVRYKREYCVTVPEDITPEMLESLDNANRLSNAADEAGIEWFAWGPNNEPLLLAEIHDVEFSQRCDTPQDFPYGAREAAQLSEVQLPGIAEA